MIDVIIDCDPGHDDAIALMLALASPELRVLGVSTVAGNTTVDKTTRNALRVLELMGRTDVPVVAGSAAPLSRPLHVAEHVHGVTGLDGPALSDPTTGPVPGDVVDVLAGWILEHDGAVTLVPTGPLTNMARLFTDRPAVLSKVERVVLMGGGIGFGNITPCAEFNIWVDPEAAAIVFASGLDITMIGLDVTHRTLLSVSDAGRLRRSGRSGEFVADLLDFFRSRYEAEFGTPIAPVHDAATIAHLIDPGLIVTEHRNVEIEVTSELTRGATVVDRVGVTGRAPNAHVGVDVDGERFARLLVERIEGIG